MILLKKTAFLLAVCVILYTKAQELPKEKFTQFSITTQQTYKNDTLVLRIENPVHCPLRLQFYSEYLKNKNIIDDTVKMVIDEKSYIEFKTLAENIDEAEINFKYIIQLGDENKTIKYNKLSLPFLNGKSYRIMQEQKGSHSHNTSGSRYAIDFEMPVGETIVAADDGYVVGVVKDYQHGGTDIQWVPFANYITIYHPHSGLFTEYVHLQKDGSFVKAGDQVKRDQPIGLSGDTGYVSGAHLHFNVFIPEKGKSIISVPFSFKNVKNKQLKKSKLVKK